MKKESSAVAVVASSSNRKLGNVAATYVSQQSCPRDCPFRRAGCYAETGPVSYTTRRLNRSTERRADRIARQEADGIDQLPAVKLLRLHVVGDCRTERAARVLRSACKRYAVRYVRAHQGDGASAVQGGRRAAWTYTHAWRTVSRPAWGNFISVLASVETLQQAKQAMRRGYAVAIVVPRFASSKAYRVGSLTIVPCPEQTRGTTCEDCGLCRDDTRLRERKLIIGFAAHGVTANTLRLSLPIV